MKKFLIFTTVVLMTVTAANAVTVSLVDPDLGHDMVANETARVYLAIDVNDIYALSTTISATNATITGGITAAQAPDYGAEWTDYTGAAVKTGGGWNKDYCFDTNIVSGKAHVGLGAEGSLTYETTIPLIAVPPAGGFGGFFGAIANSALAYIDIKAAGTGDIVLTLVNGSEHGSESLMGDLSTVPGYSGVTIDAVPEPVTIALLGLGGLFLRRRR